MSALSAANRKPQIQSAKVVLVPERDDLPGEEDPHFGNDASDSKDGMPEDADAPDPVPADI